MKQIKQRKKTLILIISSIVIIVLILASAITWYILDQQRYATTLAACKTSLTAAQHSQQNVANTLTSATVKQALTVTEDKVQDKNTVVVLRKLAERKLDKLTSCEGSYDQLQHTILSHTTAAKQATMLAEQLEHAAHGVHDSVAAHQHAVAVEQLNTTVTAALQTLKDSDGKVADGKTRETLTQRIDAARKTATDSTATIHDLQNAQQALQDAQNTVKNSMRQYEQQQQAAQAAARRAAQQRQHIRTYQRSSTSRTYNGPPKTTREAVDSDTNATCPYVAIYHNKVWCTPTEAARAALMQKADDEEWAKGNIMPCEVKFWHGCKYADGTIAP